MYMYSTMCICMYIHIHIHTYIYIYIYYIISYVWLMRVINQHCKYRWTHFVTQSKPDTFGATSLAGLFGAGSLRRSVGLSQSLRDGHQSIAIHIPIVLGSPWNSMDDHIWPQTIHHLTLCRTLSPTFQAARWTSSSPSRRWNLRKTGCRCAEKHRRPEISGPEPLLQPADGAKTAQHGGPGWVPGRGGTQQNRRPKEPCSYGHLLVITGYR